MGKQALRCETVACASLTIAMCFVYTVIMYTWLYHKPMNVLIKHCAAHTVFMYLYSIYLVSTTCYDATITLHKRNTNIQELRTLPNTLLIARMLTIVCVSQLLCTVLRLRQLHLCDWGIEYSWIHYIDDLLPQYRSSFYRSLLIGKNWSREGAGFGFGIGVC